MNSDPATKRPIRFLSRAACAIALASCGSETNAPTISSTGTALVQTIPERDPALTSIECAAIPERAWNGNYLLRPRLSDQAATALGVKLQDFIEGQHGPVECKQGIPLMEIRLGYMTVIGSTECLIVGYDAPVSVQPSGDGRISPSHPIPSTLLLAACPSQPV